MIYSNIVKYKLPKKHLDQKENLHMKYINIIKAQRAMQEIVKLKLPIKENKKSRAIYKMALDIAEIVEYIKSEEHKIIEKYNGVPQSDGTISFGNDADGVHKANMCIAEIGEFENSDVDWNHETIMLSEDSLADADNFALSPEDVFCLESFIEFE